MSDLLTAITTAHNALLIVEGDEAFKDYVHQAFNEGDAMVETLCKAREILRALHGIVCLKSGTVNVYSWGNGDTDN